MLEPLLLEALAGISPDSTAVRARLTSTLALTFSLSEQRGEGIALATEALDLARACGDDRVLAQVLTDYIWVTTGPDTLYDRIALAQEALSLGERTGDPVAQINAYNCLSHAWFELGDLETGEHALRNGQRIASQIRRPMLGWGFNVHRGSLAALRGTVAEVEHWAGELGREGTEIGVEPATILAVSSRLLFAARSEQGRLAEFEEPLRAVVDDQPELDWIVALGVLYLETDQLDRARDIVDRIRGQHAKRDMTWFPINMLSATLVAAVGDLAFADHLYEQLQPFSGRNSYDGAGTLGPVDLGLGRLATVLERWDDAEQHFEAAASRCDEWRAPMWSAHVQYEHATMLLRRDDPGDADTAVSLLEACVTTAAECGQTRLAEKADRLR